MVLYMQITKHVIKVKKNRHYFMNNITFVFGLMEEYDDIICIMHFM
jgi:sensor histidine kinase regulating citrate/malate metabolism